MPTLNAYASLAEYKAYGTDRGGSWTVSADDDAAIEGLLRTASRFIDSKTGRHYTPRIETRYVNAPDLDTNDPRAMPVDDDLLEIIALTNGDGNAIPLTEYVFKPRNTSPAFAVRLKDNSIYGWYQGINDGIAVTGVWGFHNAYGQAWFLGSTASEDLDVSETGLDVISSSAFAVGNIIRIDNELGFVSAVGTNTLTITRGENNSTAATHLTGANVKIWQPMDEVKNAVMEIANTAYHRRFGQSTSNIETVTGAGIVLSPRDIPAMAQEFIGVYRRMT